MGTGYRPLIIPHPESTGPLLELIFLPRCIIFDRNGYLHGRPGLHLLTSTVQDSLNFQALRHNKHSFENSLGNNSWFQAFPKISTKMSICHCLQVALGFCFNVLSFPWPFHGKTLQFILQSLACRTRRVWQLCLACCQILELWQLWHYLAYCNTACHTGVTSATWGVCLNVDWYKKW